VKLFQPAKTPRREPQLHHQNTTTSPQKTINIRPLFPNPPQKTPQKAQNPPSTAPTIFSGKSRKKCNDNADQALILRNTPSHTKLQAGRVAEWLMAPVLKTGVPERVSGVRIPPLPPFRLPSCSLCLDRPSLHVGTGSDKQQFPVSKSQFHVYAAPNCGEEAKAAHFQQDRRDKAWSLGR
jgi:hypothetical protein